MRLRRALRYIAFLLFRATQGCATSVSLFHIDLFVLIIVVIDWVVYKVHSIVIQVPVT
jgi:hypothetical protein